MISQEECSRSFFKKIDCKEQRSGLSRKWREKLIFLMIDALLINVFDASEMELANHCQGNRPVSKNNV